MTLFPVKSIAKVLLVTLCLVVLTAPGASAQGPVRPEKASYTYTVGEDGYVLFRAVLLLEAEDSVDEVLFNCTLMDMDLFEGWRSEKGDVQVVCGEGGSLQVRVAGSGLVTQGDKSELVIESRFPYEGSLRDMPMSLRLPVLQFADFSILKEIEVGLPGGLFVVKSYPRQVEKLGTDSHEVVRFSTMSPPSLVTLDLADTPPTLGSRLLGGWIYLIALAALAAGIAAVVTRIARHKTSGG